MEIDLGPPALVTAPIEVSCPVVPSTVYMEMLLELIFAAYANLPEGWVVTNSGEFPVATFPIEVRSPVVPSIVYIEIVPEL